MRCKVLADWRAASPRCGRTSQRTSWTNCTRPACAACASISSSGWWTPHPSEVFFKIADKIAPLGWHIVVYFEAQDLEGLTPFLKQLPAVIVVDHMGRPDIAKGVEHPDFQRFIDLMAENSNIWSKVSCPERLSVSGPPDYLDVAPFARTLVDRFPDRVLWGTDWPHPNMKSHMPDDGKLVDVIPRIATTSEKQTALLVDNPRKLYW